MTRIPISPSGALLRSNSVGDVLTYQGNEEWHGRAGPVETFTWGAAALADFPNVLLCAPMAAAIAPGLTAGTELTWSYYSPEDIVLTRLVAAVATPYATNVTFTLRRNGVDVISTTIPAGALVASVFPPGLTIVANSRLALKVSGHGSDENNRYPKALVLYRRAP